MSNNNNENNNINNNNNLIFCPLECGARIKSFYKHIKKCRKKNILYVEYFVCPYNANHIIHSKVFQIHKENCEDKKKFDSDDDDDSDDEEIINKINLYIIE